ncbi:MAG: hypothetical protein KGL39_22565 [Patescibacteria group bacterium]|nr:hypothetical protein [Patescibacteria group bacterium]
MKRSQFDDRPVKNQAKRRLVDMFKRFGAFVRQTARQSMKKSKKPAAAGKPPAVHKGLLKRLLYFWVDTKNPQLLVGPAKINGAVSPNEPEALEKGGWTRVKDRGTTRRAKIPAHPFMGPAVAKEKKHLPAIWSRAVRSS